MKQGDRVLLRTFNNTLRPPVPPRPDENYWLLIGHTGTVLPGSGLRPPGPERVAVRFDTPPASLGLTCHNPEPDTLWILPDDLERIGQE